MQLADITQLRTQGHAVAGLLQPRSQRLVPEDGAVGLAWPGWPRQAVRGGRRPSGCQHAGHEGSPRAGSIGDRPGCRSQVGASRLLGVASTGIQGGRSRPCIIGNRALLRAQGADEVPAGIHLARRAALAAQGVCGRQGHGQPQSPGSRLQRRGPQAGQGQPEPQARPPPAGQGPPRAQSRQWRRARASGQVLPRQPQKVPC